MSGLTVFADVILPNNVLAAGVSGKSQRRNERTQNQGGFDQINIIWSRTLRQYTLGTVPLSLDAWQTIEGLYEVTEAGAYGFLLDDPKDNVATVGQGFMQPVLASGVNVGTAGSGGGVPLLQLVKRYTAAGSTRTKDRIITRPRTGISILRNGSPITLGTGAGQAALDTTTGQLTMVADTSEAMTSITVGASTVLNFASGAGMVAATSVGDVVYIDSVTGTAATALNGLAHTVTAKGASSLTISTATTGLTVTVPGTAYRYPQATDTLTWSGLFYVPVHFVNDDIDWQLIAAGPRDSRYLAGPTVLLEEVRE